MIPPAFSISPVTPPTPLPLVALSLKVSPRARKSSNHVAGNVAQSLASYDDIHAMTWYFGGGLETRNATHGRVTKYQHGLEDIDKRRVQ
jgi:hypothetical protein